MKRTSLLFLVCLAIAGTLFTSCIKEEALNTEADIEMATIENGSQLLQVEPLITNNRVTFKLRHFSGNYNYSPEFVLTEGATIEPVSGTELDFQTPQTYTVTSEDGAWKKQYTIEFVVDEGTLLAYSFENVIMAGEEAPVSDAVYHKFYDYSLDMETRKEDWDSGNFGFSLIASGLGFADDPSKYPTAQTDDGYIGKGVVMQTKDTGFLGSLMKSYIAAGNLYLGYFKLDSPTIKSTRFGQPYSFVSSKINLWLL